MADVRHEIVRLRRQHPELTQREIASRVGCSSPYVSMVLRELGKPRAVTVTLFGDDFDRLVGLALKEGAATHDMARALLVDALNDAEAGAS